jgi:hypothetical protein
LKNEDKIKQANINELSNARNSNPNDLNGSSTGGVPTKPSGEKTFGQMNAEEMIEQFKNVNMIF